MAGVRSTTMAAMPPEGGRPVAHWERLIVNDLLCNGPSLIIYVTQRCGNQLLVAWSEEPKE